MSARNVKLNVILAIALVLGLLFAAAPGKVMAEDPVPAYDRGLPTANLNNAAGADRSNVAWSNDNTYRTGDTFSLGAGGEVWKVTAIRVWSISGNADEPTLELGDRFSSVSLFGAPVGQTIAELSSGALAPDSNINSNANILHSKVNYAAGVGYQGYSGAFRQIWQHDFTNLSWVIPGGANVYFSVDGIITGSGDYWFNHASNAALSGSTQTGADNLYNAWLKSDLSVSTCDSNGAVSGICDGGWDKSSDLNVQIWAEKLSDPSVLYVDDSWSATSALADPDGAGPAQAFGFDAFATIQAAIDAATTGDTINVAAGMYVEQLDISKSVTLIGAGKAVTTIKAPATFPSAADPTSAIVLIHGTDVSASISGFTVSGPGPSTCGSIRAGIYVYDSANATIDNNKIVDIRDSVFSGCQNGIAVFIGRQFWATSGTATISNNEIIGYQKGGIVVDNAGSNAIITNNTVTGVGTTAVTAQNGIQISRGATATLTGNTVTGNSYHAGTIWDWGAAGVLLYQPGNVVFAGGNALTLNDQHIYGDGANVITLGAETFGTSSAPLDNGYFIIAGTADVDATQVIFTESDITNYVIEQRIWDKVDDAALGRVEWVADNFFAYDTASLLGAMAAAQAGDTINVGPGTYTGPITVDKDITLIGANLVDGTNDAVVNGVINVSAAGATVQNLKVVPGAVTGNAAGIFVSASNVTISGNMVDSMAGDGTGSIKGIHVYSSPTVISNIALTNNVISSLSNTGKGSDGIMVQGSVDTVSVTNNTINTINSAGWAYGIEVTPSGAAPAVSPQNILIQDNIIDTVKNAGVSIDVAGNPEVAADAREVIVIENSFANAPYAIINKDAANTLNASPNWFGSITGPVSDTLLGLVDADPWCGNAGCTFTVTSNPSGQVLLPIGIDPADIQAALDSVPEGTKLVLPTGLINKSGGFNVTVPHTTLILSAGTIIQNSSPCFEINADYTTITAVSKLAAQCVPTAASDGIEVVGPRVNVVIENIDFVGTTGTNGVHFQGIVTDLVIKDNFFHGFAGNGLLFSAQPAGVLDIHGNLFLNNALKGIEAGAFTVPAEYNSWGHVDGAAAPAGDGISIGVDADPWTHVDLYMTSSGSPVTNTVAKNNTITYTVYGNFANTMGVEFNLFYPANLTVVTDSWINSGTFDVLSSFNTATPGKIGFKGTAHNYVAVNGNLPIFSVTFTGFSPIVNAQLNLDDTTDNFAMGGAGSSTNIYALTLVDGAVTVLDRFSITGTVSMQGRTTRAGVQLLLANGILMNYGPFQTTSGTTISGNFSWTDLVADTYRFTTNQPRYLNVIDDNLKDIVVGSNVILQPLELKGGDVNQDNLIGGGDASIIGSSYGQAGDLNGDINYNGTVDIFDLAMVGGNYLMTSQTAYGIGSLVWVP